MRQEFTAVTAEVSVRSSGELCANWSLHFRDLLAWLALCRTGLIAATHPLHVQSHIGTHAALMQKLPIWF